MIDWIGPNWPAPAGIHAVTTLRCGGVSRGGYAGFNPAAHVGDDPEAVRENRRLLRQALSLPAEPVWLNQVHGVRAVRAEVAGRGESADASYTDRSGVVCAVLTADCLPVLLLDREGDVMAAVHAGWRGLLAGVIEAVLAKMAVKEVLAWLGPAIGPDHFEVGGEVRAAFLRKSELFAAAFRPREEGKWLADLYAIARLVLADRGVDEIFGGNFCTYADSERFFSYRRDGVTGRMATLIWRD